MKILIIVPCYNEQDNIKDLYNEIKEKANYDVIFINDASIDNSGQILRNEKIPHIDLPLNLGIGGAVQTGYRFAIRNGYDIAVQLDGDGQHNPVYIDELIKPIIKNQADMVIGSRFLKKKDYPGYKSTAIRRVGIKYFNRLIYLLTGQRITDATSGLRALNKKAMSLFVNYYAKDYPEPESNTLAIRNKFKVIEIPVEMRQRQGGKSSISAIGSLYYMIKVTIGILISLIKPKFITTDKEVS